VEWLDDAFCGNKTSGEKDKADWGQSEVMKKGDEGRRNFALAKGPKPREQQRSRNRNNEGLTGEESGCFRKEWVDRWE
jgi:hypothetical protein